MQRLVSGAEFRAMHEGWKAFDRSFRMLLSPMVNGTDSARAIAKNFANGMRGLNHRFGQLDDMRLAAEVMALAIEEAKAPREFSVMVEKRLHATLLDPHAHDHEHEHEHGDDCGCAHDHDHSHGHDHSHDHGHGKRS